MKCLRRLLGWIVARPSQGPRSKLKRRLSRLGFIAVTVLLAWFLFLGPGVVLLPFTPRGYRSITDETFRVYYRNDDAAARDVLGKAQEAKSAILSFWGRPEDAHLFSGVEVYLGETPDAYYRLTLNRAGGSALLGGVIVINLSMEGRNLSLDDFIHHELAHIYLRRRLGYLRKHLTVPMWFDEGCAVRLQGDSPDVKELGDRLAARPRLLSVTSLRYATDWEAMVFMENSGLARQHYGYVGAFVTHLEELYGVEAIRRYLDSLGWRQDPDAVFATVFGTSLAAEEDRFLSEGKRLGRIPSTIELIPVPIVPHVVIRWTVLVAVVAFLIFWSIRQVFRLSRFVAARRG